MLKKGFWLIIAFTIPNVIHAQSARFAGIGYSSVVLYDAWSVSNNQAGLANVNDATLAFGYENKFQLKETSTQTAALILPTKTGNFAVSYKRFGYELYAENKIGLAFARNLGKYFSAGLQFDYLYYQQTEDYGNRGAFLFEVGIIAKPIDKLFIGVHLYNPSKTKLADYDDERVSTIMRFGMGYYFTEQVVLTIETEKDIYQKARIKGGIEYEPLTHLFLRTGFGTEPNQFSCGLGYRFWNFTTDIAVSTHESLPLSTEISLKYSFK